MRYGWTLLLILALFSGCSEAAPKADVVAPAASAAPAPTITAVGADAVGKLLAAAKGKVVVLNFWATWCPPCVAEMPEFVRFYNETSRDKVAFISLNANLPEDLRTAVASFQKDKGLPFPIYVYNDAGGVEALAKVTGATLSGGLPTTLIFDREGKVVHTWERTATLDDLNAAVKPLL